MRVPVMRLRLLKEGLAIIEGAPIDRQLRQPKVQIAKPAWNKSGPGELNGSFEVFRRGRIILFLPLKVTQTAQNVNPLAGTPTVSRYFERFQQRGLGKSEVTSIAKKISVLAKAPGEKVGILSLSCVAYCAYEQLPSGAVVSPERPKIAA
jgi:hypothetical protein